MFLSRNISQNAHCHRHNIEHSADRQYHILYFYVLPDGWCCHIVACVANQLNRQCIDFDWSILVLLRWRHDLVDSHLSSGTERVQQTLLAWRTSSCPNISTVQCSNQSENKCVIVFSVHVLKALTFLQLHWFTKIEILPNWFISFLITLPQQLTSSVVQTPNRSTPCELYHINHNILDEATSAGSCFEVEKLLHVCFLCCFSSDNPDKQPLTCLFHWGAFKAYDHCSGMPEECSVLTVRYATMEWLFLVMLGWLRPLQIGTHYCDGGAGSQC